MSSVITSQTITQVPNNRITVILRTKAQIAADNALNAAKSFATPRMLKNCTYTAIAGGISTVGGIISGLPAIDSSVEVYSAVIVGASTAAAGNAASTILPWDTGQIAIIENELGEISNSIQMKKDELNSEAYWNDSLAYLDVIEAQEEETCNNESSILDQNDIEMDTKATHDIESGLPVENGHSTQINVTVSKKVHNLAINCSLATINAINKRNVANILRALAAAGLTGAGGAVAGFPVFVEPMGIISAVLVGSLLGAVGNAASTYLAWDTGKIRELRRKIAFLNEEIDKLLNEFEFDLEAQAPVRITGESTEEAPVKSCDTVLKSLNALFHDSVKEARKYVNMRNGKNCLRVAFAGGLSGAGGVIAGLPQIAETLGVVTAVITGAVVGGVGNGASTKLAWDTGDLDELKNEIHILKAKLERLQNHYTLET